MSSVQSLIIASKGSAASFNSVCDLSPGELEAASNFVSYLNGLIAGALEGAVLIFRLSMAYANASITVGAGGSVAGQSFSVANVTVTARASSPAVNEFVVSPTPAIQAANMAAAINDSPDFLGKITASSLGGVLTITSSLPGLMGNGLQFRVGSLSNVTAVPFADGREGTTGYIIDLS